MGFVFWCAIRRRRQECDSSPPRGGGGELRDSASRILSIIFHALPFVRTKGNTKNCRGETISGSATAPALNRMPSALLKQSKGLRFFTLRRCGRPSSEIASAAGEAGACVLIKCFRAASRAVLRTAHTTSCHRAAACGKSRKTDYTQTAKKSPCGLQGDVKGPRAENRTEKATSRSSRRGSRGSR